MIGPFGGIRIQCWFYSTSLGTCVASLLRLVPLALSSLSWNAIRMACGTPKNLITKVSEITKDMSGGILQELAGEYPWDVHHILVERWVSIKFVFNVSSVLERQSLYPLG